jgi:hypothetical protein
MRALVPQGCEVMLVALRRAIPPLLVGLLALVPSQAQGASKHLWATVNVCDTKAHPGVIGIRASMPGNGRRERLYMRFEVQWFSFAKNRWLDTKSRTGWRHVGSARYRSTQAGFSFKFADPPPGSEFRLRGEVGFQWRARKRKSKRYRVVERATRTTRAGIRGVEGGDPKGRSDAACVIRR